MKNNKPVNWDWAGMRTKANRSIVLHEIFTPLERNDFFEVMFEFK